ncbi:hypothetical protein SDRG_17316 [Saprolegnia diclina VS20]|uniref:Uncharacterized protein n=1 Tax=Saprolegnia diclina (strain VS20) TaxID=1156394 RepID=T0QYG1_SAPDV|nr:hypothetical protein SDRG_17316 [Saprolegnia diclina VS20]EQC24793.1 hypothetical protein SDRG_17316 [Saprolegnia diclina VS20]|eukprot:XP_008621779.1 hypothetical protein SDRG_17316 [Saprolegnia diclina VS20]
MVVGHAAKKTCHHCGRFVVRGLYTIDDRNEHYGKKLCMACMEMPMFNEIGHMEALRKYKLKHHELHSLPVRLAPDGYYTYDYEPPMKKMYNLQVVLDLVAQLR